MRVAELCSFIAERERVRLRKEDGEPKPWTLDPILQGYRFCNVHREDDTETKWIAKHWRNPHSNYPDLWFAMVVARLFNWHGTLEAIEFPHAFDAAYIKRMRRVLMKRKEVGEKIWTGAYMVSTNGQPVEFKHDYVIDKVLKPAWKARSWVRPVEGDTLASFNERLLLLEGMGTFMAGQVIADLKFAEGSELRLASDWMTWVAPGPGSKRGLNRVCGRELRAPWPKQTFHETLRGLQELVNSDKLVQKFDRLLHAQDLQNCLCEFDKYERVRLGEGRPRSRYNGKGE